MSLLAYVILYQDKPGGIPKEISDVYDADVAIAKSREAMTHSKPGSAVVIWRAPYDEHTSWTEWGWRRWKAFVKAGSELRTVSLDDVPIGTQPYLDPAPTNLVEELRQRRGLARPANPDLDIPEDIPPLGKMAARLILTFLHRHRLTSTGGCRAFYSAAEWARRGHGTHKGALLIVVHDGGDLAPLLREEDPLSERLRQGMEKAGFWFELMTSVSTAVYPITS